MTDSPHASSEIQDKQYKYNEIDLTSVQELRNLLAAHRMRPLKSFGQNFLVDRSGFTEYR